MPQDNDWILPDPDRYISSHHCKVEFRAGHWVLEDTSTNGVFINGSDVPASVDGAYALKDGDRLRLGDYEILVSIDERNDFPPDASGQMPAPARAAPSRRGSPASGEDLGEELDLTDLLSDAAMKPVEPSKPGPGGRAPAVRPEQGAGHRPAADPARLPGDNSLTSTGRQAGTQRLHLVAGRPAGRRRAAHHRASTASQKTGRCRRSRTIASRCRH